MFSKLEIRPFISADLPSVSKILLDTGMFNAAEIDIARELIDLYLQRAEQKDYLIYCIVNASSQVLGYVCFGPTPATEASYDLYWIAVDPACQKQGIGRQLLHFAENECCRQGGKLLIIETSSRQQYLPTRQFYLNNGYQLEARIKDFYAAGDDRLIFTRRFP